MSARTLKIRSEQNGRYSKKFLQRMRFTLPSTEGLVDAGNSYLSLQTSLLNTAGDVIDTKQPAGGVSPFFYSFGDGTAPYSASCLFRTAKLFNQQSGSVIEEINFQNYKTANFEALQHDIDTLGSSTSFSGSALAESILDNIQSNYSVWAQGGTQELHIKLKDLFPSLNTSVYSLSQVPLIIDLEMEVTREMIMKMTANLYVQEPPSIVESGDKGYVTTNIPETCLVESQLNKLYANVQTPSKVLRPDFWVYLAIEYDAETLYGARSVDGDVDPVEKITIDSKWVTKDLTELGFGQGVPVDITQTIKTNESVLVADFSYLTTINAVAADGTGDKSELSMTIPTQAVRNTYANNEVVTLQSFNPYVSTGKTAGFFCEATPTDAAAFTKLKDEKKYVLTAADLAHFVAAGLLKLNTTTGHHEIVAGMNFQVNLRLTTLVAGLDSIVVASDALVYNDGAADWEVSNQGKMMPRVTPKAMSLSSFDHTTSTIEFSDDFELGATAGLESVGFFHIKSDGTIEAATSFKLAIVDIELAGETSIVGEVVKGAYAEVNKAEIVLKQYGAGKLSMPSMYRTMRVEPFVIPSNFNEYVGNFQVEGNCYNAWVLLPPSSQSGSLMSTGRGVGSWRTTIDEVDLTNVDVRMTGQYPSTLYFDRLVDCMSNSQMQLRNLEGIATGAEAGKIRLIPIKMYNGIVGGQPVMSPAMKRLQIRLLAESGGNIEGGTAYLFKECYKQF